MMPAHEARRLKLRKDPVNCREADVVTGVEQLSVDIFGAQMVPIGSLENLENF